MTNEPEDQPRPHLALEAETAFFDSNRMRWIEEGHDLEWVALKGTDVFGFFGSMGDAYAAGVSRVGGEPFLVRQVRREDPIVVIQRAGLRKRA